MNKLSEHDHTYDNGYAILTDLEVEDVRFRYSQGERQADLARDYGVTRFCIYSIVHYRRRKNAGR